ncbi:MAG: hypothetical protein JWO82_3910 [Akkermansiaceae bacterium]|nr:hypothetical protein [Akkermansiaceae bacterium]
MELKSFTLGRKVIKSHVVFNPGSEDPAAPQSETSTSTAEKPLPECYEAFGALRPVACEVMGWAKSYVEGLDITKLSLTVTKNGTRAVSLGLQKALDTIGGHLHPMATPFFKIDPPGDGESGKLEVSPKSAELVKTALREAERYIEGERSQQILDFDGDKTAANAQFRDKEEPAFL